jgi:hypothetical protein
VRKKTPTKNTRRYWLTLDGENADRLDAYAASVDLGPSTVAGELLVSAVDRARGEPNGTLTAARQETGRLQREVRRLEAQLEEADRQAAELRHQAQERGDPEPPKLARWERPVEEVLAEPTWWDRWLPRLYELLGRDLVLQQAESGTFGQREPIVDDRGYSDLMAYLFPPIREAGGRVMTWRNPEYAARAAGQHQQGILPPTRPHVWEPVVRHVALALATLERTSSAGTDPQVRLEALERLHGAWARTLRYLVGQGSPDLPRELH